MIACPSCGGTLQQLPGALVGYKVVPVIFVVGKSEVRVQLQPRTMVACTECEYAKEAR